MFVELNAGQSEVTKILELEDSMKKININDIKSGEEKSLDQCIELLQ